MTSVQRTICCEKYPPLGRDVKAGGPIGVLSADPHAFAKHRIVRRRRAQEGVDVKARTIRGCGAMVVFGAIAWSYGWLQAGVRPEGVNDQVEIWMSGLFQLGLVAL